MNNKIQWRNILRYFLYSFLGTMLTVYTVVIGCNVIIASSIVGVIFSLITITYMDENRCAWAGFAGSFAGMTSLSYLAYMGSGYYTFDFFIQVLFLSLIVGFLYSLSEVISYVYPGMFFDGYGGRLGTIAFISVLIYLFYTFFVHQNPVPIINYESYEHLEDPLFYLVIAFAIAGAMISMEIKNAVSSLNDNYKVLTVALTGLIGGILVVKIPVYGMDYAAAWYTGAFVGMSSYFILMLKRNFFFSGMLSGVFFLLLRGMFTGVGGKLGFISFVAVLVMRGTSKIYGKLIRYINMPQNMESSYSTDGGADMVVDDRYAEELVASLLRAKESQPSDESEASTVDVEHGGKSEYCDPTNEICEYIRRFASLNHWISVKGYDSMLYMYEQKGISDETAAKFQFKKESEFIQLLTKEKRILTFVGEGLHQNIFKKRIAQSELELFKAVSILPIFLGEELDMVYFIFFKTSDKSVIKNTIKNLKSTMKEYITT